MSNIRPIGDPAIATAMLASMQSIDATRSAPSGMSSTCWRILQCIAKAAPNVPTMGELRMCSGLNRAALADELQALRWKGLIEMGGLRLSPSAAEMVGIEQPYPPKDAKRAARKPRDLMNALTAAAKRIDEAEQLLLSAPLVETDQDPAHVEIIRRSLVNIGVRELPIFPYSAAPTIIGVDIARGPDVTIEALVTFGADGKIAKIEPLPTQAEPLDPADVPACMRPDCMPPERPIPARAPRKKTDDGRGGAAVAYPIDGGLERDRVAPDRAPETPEEVAGSNPVPAQPAAPRISAPPAEPPKFVNWIEQRQRRIDSAIAFLRGQQVAVSIADRNAEIRTYFVSANRRSLFAEEVIEMAIERGWSE